MRRAVRWLSSLVLLLVAPAALLAQSGYTAPNHLYDKWQLSASGTLMLYSTSLRIDPDGDGEGTEIDAEDVLGLEATNFEPRLAGRWRFGHRHELEAGWQWADRNSSKTLVDTIFIKDTSFAAGLRVNAKFNTNQLFLTYRYAFVAKEKSQIGLGVGLGAIFLDERIEALAGATGGTDTVTVSYAQEESFPGPTASFGLYGRFRIGNRWYLEPDARALYLKISNVKATVFEGGLAAKYWFSDDFGAEVAYGIGAYSVTLTRDGTLVDLSGKIKYTNQGIRFGLNWAP